MRRRWPFVIAALAVVEIEACGTFTADTPANADGDGGDAGRTDDIDARVDPPDAARAEGGCTGHPVYCLTPPCTPEVFTTTGAIGGFAVHAGAVYWTSNTEVFRQPTDGDFLTRTTVATGQVSAGPIVADDDGVFWFDRDAGKVWRCPLVGACTPMLVASGPPATSTEAIGMTLDRDNVYWAAFRGPAGDGGVFGTTKDGGALLAVSVGTSGQYAKYVAADGVDVYWLTNCYGAFSRKKDLSGDEVPLPGVTACTAGLGGLAVGHGAVFVGGTELDRFPLGAGALAKLSVLPEVVSGLAIDCANAVYWTQMLDGGSSLLSLPESAFLPDGGVDIAARVTLAENTTTTLIVADSTGLYWAAGSAIMRLVGAP